MRLSAIACSVSLVTLACTVNNNTIVDTDGSVTPDGGSGLLGVSASSANLDGTDVSKVALHEARSGSWSTQTQLTILDHFKGEGSCSPRSTTARAREARLSPREREVVHFAARGHSNKLIGYELGLATSTVGVLLWRAAAKLGVSSREEFLRSVSRPR